MAPADGDRCLQVPNAREWQVRVSGAQGLVWWLGRASVDVSVLQHVGCGTCACHLWLSGPLGKVKGDDGNLGVLSQHLSVLGSCPIEQ